MKCGWFTSENRRRWLWGLTACLLVGLAVTVAILGKASVETGQSVLLPFVTFQAVLVGLVGLFVIYVSLQHERLRSSEVEARQRTLHEEILRARLIELAGLLDVSGELSQALDLRSMLGLAARSLLPCLQADHSSILLFNPRVQRLEEAV